MSGTQGNVLMIASQNLVQQGWSGPLPPVSADRRALTLDDLEGAA
jgi:hypothetical protein